MASQVYSQQGPKYVRNAHGELAQYLYFSSSCRTCITVSVQQISQMLDVKTFFIMYASQSFKIYKK